MTITMSETKTLASYIVNGRYEDIPDDVRHEAGAIAGQLHGLRARRQRRSGGRHRDPRARAVFRQADGGDPRTRRAARPAARLADERHQLARGRLRRHDAEELHPPDVAGGVGAVRVRERQPGDAAATSSTRSSSASRPSRASATPSIPAHYDVGWHITGTRRRVRRRRGDRQAARPDRAADGLGARPGGDAGRRACARCSARWGRRFTRAARRRTATRRRCSPRQASRPASAASKGRAASRPCRPRQYDLSKVTAGLGVDFNLRAQHLQAVPLRHRQPSDDRRRASSCTTSTRARTGVGHRRRAPARRAAGARPVQPAGHHQGTAGQVLGVSRRGRRPGARQGRPRRVHRCGGQRSRGQARARARDGRGRSGADRGSGAHRSRADGRPHAFRGSSSSRSATSIGRCRTGSSTRSSAISAARVAACRRR